MVSGKLVLWAVVLLLATTPGKCDDTKSLIEPIKPVLTPFGVVGDVLASSVSPLVAAAKQIPSWFQSTPLDAAEESSPKESSTEDGEKDNSDLAPIIYDEDEEDNDEGDGGLQIAEVTKEAAPAVGIVVDAPAVAVVNSGEPAPAPAPKKVTQEDLLQSTLATEIAKLPEDVASSSKYLVSFVKVSNKGYMKYNKTKYQLYYLPTNDSSENNKFEFDWYIQIPAEVAQDNPSKVFLKVTSNQNGGVTLTYTTDCGAETELVYTSVSSDDVLSNTTILDNSSSPQISFSDKIRLYFHLTNFPLGKGKSKTSNEIVQNNLIFNIFTKTNYKTFAGEYTKPDGNKIYGNLPGASKLLFASNVALFKRPAHYCTCCLVSDKSNKSGIGQSCTTSNCEMKRTRFPGETIVDATTKISSSKTRELAYACSTGTKTECKKETKEGTFYPTQKKGEKKFDESYVLIDTFLDSYLPTNWTSITKETSRPTAKLRLKEPSKNILVKDP